MAEADVEPLDFDYDSDDFNPNEEKDATRTINLIPPEDRFVFTPIKCTVMDELKEKWPDTYELLKNKWGHFKTMKFLDYTYDKHFEPHQKSGFGLSFFLSKVVRATLRTERARGRFDCVSLAYAIDSVQAEKCPCDVLNMEFFDKLWIEGLVNEEGEMKKLKHDYLGDIPVDDQVRSMLVLRYSEFIDLYSKEERMEFLFKIFENIVVGGEPDKFEHQIYPYLHTSRILYKLLVSTIRDQNTGVISVSSHVFKVKAKMGDYKVFPHNSGSRDTFCFFIIDDRKKRLRVWFSFLP